MKVQALRADWSALAWMAYHQKPPKFKEKAELPGLGEVNVGMFWDDCKCKRRCGRKPYNRLLVNPVLRADYRSHAQRHKRAMVKQQNIMSPSVKVQSLRVD